MLPLGVVLGAIFRVWSFPEFGVLGSDFQTVRI